MNQDDFVHHLKQSIPPWPESGPRSDLWPRMLRRIEEPQLRFGWLDAALAGLAAASLLVFPRLIPLMLYHL